MLSLNDAVIEIKSGRFVLLIAVFIGLSLIVASGITLTFDEGILRTIADSRNLPMDVAMITITTSADLAPVYFSPIIVISFIFVVLRKTRRVGAILLLAIAISVLTTQYTKEIIHRERPISFEFHPNLGFNYKLQSDVVSESSSSFPSGHSARGAAFALIVSFLLRNRSIGGIPAPMLMWIYPALVAFSRLYVGVHYPTDVIGGVILGLLVANVLGRVLKLEPPPEKLRI